MDRYRIELDPSRSKTLVLHDSLGEMAAIALYFERLEELGSDAVLRINRQSDGVSMRIHRPETPGDNWRLEA